MIYCDTSLIVSAITNEQGSRESRRWIAGRGDLAVSAWVATEIAAALAMKQRQGLMSIAERLRVLTGWLAMRMACFEDLEVAAKDFSRAERLVDLGRGLRAADALHLAIALRHGCELVTRDRALAEAATATGLGAHLLCDVDSG